MVSRTTRLLYKFLPQNKINSDGPERKDKEFKVILGNLCFRPAWTTEDPQQISKQQAYGEIDGVVTDAWCVFIDSDMEIARALK